MEVSSAAAPASNAQAATKAAAPPRYQLGFVLFILLNALLFIRPGDLLPSLDGAPLYEILIVICLLSSLPAVLAELSLGSLAKRPITVFVLGLLPAIVLSQLSHGRTYEARIGAFNFLKVVAYYLLLVRLVDSPARLRIFLLATALFIFAITVLCLLNWHGVVNLEAISPLDQHETGDAMTLRLRGPGIFHDPNDLSLVLVIGILISARFLLAKNIKTMLRTAMLVPIASFGYAFSLTRSRGGMLSLLVGLSVYLMCRFGRRRALLAGLLLLPAIFFAFAGRQTDFDLDNKDDTAMGRVYLWRDSLVEFHSAPIFGIGIGQLAEENGLVAHNSYVHAFAELGLLGGIFFVGAISVAITGLYRVRRLLEVLEASGLAEWWPCVFAMLAAYLAGLYSLSRVYALTTYVILGAAAAYLNCVEARIPFSMPRMSQRLLVRTAGIGIGVLLFLEVFVRIMAR